MSTVRTRVAVAGLVLLASVGEAGAAELDAGAPGRVEAPAADRPDVQALEAVAVALRAGDLAEAGERVHGLVRADSPVAVPALRAVVTVALQRARAGDARAVAPVVERLRELPTSRPDIGGPVARLLGAQAVAEASAGASEPARLHARAALELDERVGDAWLALGELRFRDNDVPGAIDLWERGARLVPTDTSLARRLERGRREATQVAGLDRLASTHFVVSFDGVADVPAARATLESMEDAHRSVGALFQHWPDGPIALVLYPAGRYREQGHATWSAGVYDGKIRLPVEGAVQQTLRYRSTLFHEYAHALLHRAVGTTAVPAWFNEGLAQLAGLRASPGPAVGCAGGHAAPLSELEAGFGRFDERTARAAYAEARHAVERLAERHGEDGLRTLVREAGERRDFKAGFRAAFGRELDEFTREFDAEARR